MKAISVTACAFCAVFGLAVSATAETETIAYWPFGTNGFHDVSGNGHDLVGNEVAESDAAYMVLNQGRTDQFLQTAAALDLSGEQAVTFECWFRQTPAKPANVTCLLMSSANPMTGTGGFLITNNGRIQSQYRAVEGGWQIDYSDPAHPSAWNDGMWHHVGYVVERSRQPQDHFTCRLYVDGVRQTSGSANPVLAPIFNDVFMIGGGSTTYEAGNNYFRGYIDDVRISRGVVAPTDFLKYPTVGKTMRADDGKLPVVAYWPFGGKRGKDVTGNGFDLTMDATFPMLSGTPNLQWATRTSWTNCYLTSFPFSAFSKTGVTIECFARSGSTADTGNILVETDAYYNNPGAFRFSYEGANDISDGFKRVGIHYRLSSGKYATVMTTESESGAMNDGKWRHFAVVYDPSKVGHGIVSLYVDGVAATDNSETPADQGAFALLDHKLKFAQSFYGQFDDVRITAGVLTPDQFLTSRSVGSTVALYRFDYGTLEDQTGNGHELVHENGTATFGDGGSSASGTGLVLSGKNAGKEWIRTKDPVDFTHTKAMTIEFDFVSDRPASDNSAVYVLAASTNATTERGGFVLYRSGDGIQAQFRKNASAWVNYYNQEMTATADGSHRGRYMVNANTAGSMAFNLCVDGTSKPNTQVETFDSLGTPVLCFGHSPSYYGPIDCSNPSSICYMKGKLLRVAVSDTALEPADYVLDNLPPDPETKATLAYWDFNGFDDKSGSGNDLTVSSGCKIRRGALALDGASSAVTDDTLYLSDLTQATIECFVCFGGSASSGTLFSMGSGAGSFTVTADATAGTLSGSFIPYDHLAASNGGTAAPDPFEGRKVWHHVALVIDRTKSGADAVRFYVDYQRATPAGRAWDNAAAMLDGTLVVGADSAQTGSFFTGFIDDLRVSKGALEPSEFIQASARTEIPDGVCILVR
ncbi:MAG: laminin G domain-containing protein [Kiritimatiellae bacterium]|nr:laminin G domain-containing protein [Kiritimatiellia bacterium]